MKTKTFYTIILMVFSAPLFSQNVEDYLSRYQYQQAIDYLEQANDTSKVAGLQRVSCYNYLQNYPKAVEILLNLQEKYPEDVQIKMQLALCYNKLSMIQESVKYFDELIQMDSTNAYFKIQKADLLYQAGKYDQALEQYKYALGEYNATNLMKQAAFCFEKMNQMDSATIYFNRILEIDPTDQKSKEELIKININQEDYRSGVENSERFLATDADNVPINLLKGVCFYQLNEYEQAIYSLDKCRLLGDTSYALNKYLGISYCFSLQYENAYPYLVQAYSQDTLNTIVLYALATVNMHLDSLPEAIRLYEKLLQKVLPPANSLFTYYNNLAESYAGHHEIMRAIENYKKALIYISDFQDMDVLYHIANLYDTKVHNYQFAVDYYKQYRKGLVRYQQFLIEIGQSEAVTIKITDELKHLDERVTYLENRIAREKK